MIYIFWSVFLVVGIVYIIIREHKNIKRYNRQCEFGLAKKKREWREREMRKQKRENKWWIPANEVEREIETDWHEHQNYNDGDIENEEDKTEEEEDAILGL